jgi:hypothetical protein
MTGARHGSLLALLVACTCVLGIALVQAPLARRLVPVKALDEVYALPPPDTIKLVALGYDSAGADLIWAKLLVEYGTHAASKTYFREAPRFIDDIIALDPRHRTLYRYHPIFLIYQSNETNATHGGADDARAAKHYYEEGLKAFPYDGDLWLDYGQFIAFMGPAFLSDKAEIDRWKVEGAKAIARAMELGVSVDRTMAAGYLLGKAGETKAAITYWERAWAMANSDEERDRIEKILEKLRAGLVDDKRRRVIRTIEATWRASYPYLTRGQFLLMTPAPSPPRCAGLGHDEELDCMTSWDDITERGIR